MITISKWAMLVVILSGTAYAQQPPDIVTSDGCANTAMGTNALLSNLIVGSPCPPYGSNTAAGYQALTANTTGSLNTAFGADALYRNTSGPNNTAVGLAALAENTTGGNNTAVGDEAMRVNNGSDNSAFGLEALWQNSTGESNTAVGVDSLISNETGSFNTATGVFSLYTNTSGNYNTAVGYNTLFGTVGAPPAPNGSDNTAMGYSAMYSNAAGGQNSAYGVRALYSNTTGDNNVALGPSALEANSTGSNNIALGTSAGSLITASNNIDIGNEGSASDSGVIRIGTEGTHTGTAIAGIYGVSVSGGVEVVINTKGKLGVKTSARRYKDDIRSISDSSNGLYRLRPVTFRYKEPEPDGSKPVQYGLIAEEVAKVYPELVIRDDKGRIDGVRYDELAPMLLNEVQKQQKIVATQAAKIAAENQRAATQDAKIASLERQLAGIHAALVKLQPKDQVVAQR